MARPGPQPKPRPLKPREPTEAERLAKLLMSAPSERQEQMVDAIWDNACGYRLFTAGCKKPGGKGIGQSETAATLTLADGTTYEGYFYTVPGDIAAQKLLLEHGAGRPAVRENQKLDPNVYIRHLVPGKPSHLPSSAAAEPEMDEDDELTMDVPVGADGVGMGWYAVCPPDPEDEASDDTD